jgi:hypothetical protein
MDLKTIIEIALFNELSRMTGQRVWGSRPGLKKMGRVARGEGLFGKIPAARKINTKAIADVLANKAKDLRNPIMIKPDARMKRASDALEKASIKVGARA